MKDYTMTDHTEIYVLENPSSYEDEEQIKKEAEREYEQDSDIRDKKEQDKLRRRYANKYIR